MDDKRLRFDLFIAGMALVISTFAAAASAYQAYVINQQFSATVWPYLSLSTSYDRSNKFIELDVRNQGLGPAIVRSATVTVAGVPVSAKGGANAFDAAIAQDLAQARTQENAEHLHGVIHTTSSSL